MKQGKPFGPGDQGFALIALMLALTVLSMATIYVVNQSQLLNSSKKSSEIDRARSLSELNNLSNLGRVRGLVSTAKNGEKYEVGIYPKNYFAKRWVLEKNSSSDKPMDMITVDGDHIWLPTNSSGILTLAKAQEIFGGATNQLALLNATQQVEIINNNPDKKHPYFIESIDIRTSRPLDLKGSNATQDVHTTGRIKLAAPRPQSQRLLVKFPGQSTFDADWQKKNGVFPPGDYTFQLRASGIVYYGEIMIGAETYIVGLDAQGKEIIHGANNIKAVDEIIGEKVVRLGDQASGRGEFDDARVTFTECRVGLEPLADTNPSGPTGLKFKIEAKAIGVEMKENDELEKVEGTIVVSGPQVPAPSAPTIGSGCNQSCPYEFRTDFWFNPEVQAKFLDLTVNGETDTTKLDYFEPDISNLIDSKARGVICSNMELVGQAMKGESGINPTLMLSGNRLDYEKLRDKHMDLKRFYAYTAPSCLRQLIGQRTECGCFADDTKIMMGDGSLTAIRDIRAGDAVWNPKLGRAQIVKRVIAGPEKIPMYKIYAGDEHILVTRQHPFLLKSGPVSAAALKIGDRILRGTTGDDLQTITAIELVPWDGQSEAPVVWNIELSGSEDFTDHYLFADGIMTGDLFLQETLAKRAAQEKQR